MSLHCIICAMCQGVRAENLTICYRKKQIDISFSRICPVIDNEFCCNIVKVVCGITQFVDPHDEINDQQQGRHMKS